MVVVESAPLETRTASKEVRYFTPSWNELIATNRISKEQAELQISLSRQHRLTYDGERTTDEKTAIQYVSNYIYFVPPPDTDKPSSFDDRKLVAQITFSLTPSKGEQGVQIVIDSDIPAEIIEFIIEGFQLYPHNWNPHTMALYETVSR